MTPAPSAGATPPHSGWVRAAALALSLAALAALPLALGSRPFELRLLTLVFLYAAMGQAWNLLAGYAGQASLGHGMFFGIGAYVSTLAVLRICLLYTSPSPRD